MTYPLVSELAEAGIPVTVSCRVLKLARQPYYRWRNDPLRDADVLRAYRVNALHDAHHDDPTFGYRYLADEARRARWRMSRRTAWKLCSQAGILSSAQRRRRGKGKKAGPPVFDDHVQRVFRADAPNRLWLTDITEHWTAEGKLYCCAIKDGRFQGANATLLISSSSFSRGVWNPRVLRGRSLSWVTMAWISASVTALKSVPFG